MKNLKRVCVAAVLMAILPLLIACGGSGGGSGSTPGWLSRYTVGGTVTGLEGALILQNNNGNNIALYENGTFVFQNALAAGAAYNVTISYKPMRQQCTVTNGSGTIKSENITNIRVTCDGYDGGVTLSGKIAVPQGVVLDSSVNDWNERYANNETFVSAQILPNPISVGGYVNWVGGGHPQGRLYSYGNPDDFYQVQLKKDDVITLAIGEWDTARNDLDLYLYDKDRKPVSYSAGDGTYEFVTAPSDGTYFVVVSFYYGPPYYYRGASNYILTIGADMAAAAAAFADHGVLSSQHETVPDQVIVRFKDNVKTSSSTFQTFTQYADDMGLTAVAGSPEREMLFSIDDLKYQAYSSKIYDVQQKSYEREIAGDTEKARPWTTLHAIKELRKRPDILSADPNYVVHTYATPPDDPYYGYQWNLPMISLPEAWDESRSSQNQEVIVAVVDSGVLLKHPDLENRLTAGYNFVKANGVGPNPNDPGDKEPGTSWSSFHGTHVAGIIAAQTDNKIGVAGVTEKWNTKIMPVRVIGAGGKGNTYDVMQGVRYAAGLDNDYGVRPAKPVDIINLSLGGGGFSSTEQLMYDKIREKDILVIAAAGNENTSIPSYPANYDGVISVSAVNINGKKASYSNYGTYDRIKDKYTIDVAAPGGDSGDFNGDGNPDYILSTGGDDSSGSVIYRYTLMAGTSMAAPHVSGVAALMKAVYPELSFEDFKKLLETGEITNDIGDPAYYGYGLINAFKAVAAAKNLRADGSINGLNVSPRSVYFDFFSSDNKTQQATIKVSQIGAEKISVTPGKNAEWLTVERSSVDEFGIGDYIIRVDPSNPALQKAGVYTDKITFTSSSGKVVSVNVTVQIRSGNNVTYDAGYHYVMLIKIKDDNSVEDIDQYGVKASGGFYYYAFSNVPPGRYLIIAGSDRNFDGYIGDGGEALGAYPTVGQMVEIDTDKDRIDRDNLNFTTNLISSVSNSNMAFGGMIAIDKTAIKSPAPVVNEPPASAIKRLRHGNAE